MFRGTYSGTTTRNTPEKNCQASSHPAMTSSSVIENVRYTNMYREKHAVNTSARSLRRLPSRRDQPQIPEIDLQLTARRPVIDRRGHLAAATPLGREPVQRPLRHHHALPGQQDPDLHHRHVALDPLHDLRGGLQLRPALAVPVRPHRPHYRHDLADELIGELPLTPIPQQAGRHRSRDITPAGLAVKRRPAWPPPAHSSPRATPAALHEPRSQTPPGTPSRRPPVARLAEIKPG